MQNIRLCTMKWLHVQEQRDMRMNDIRLLKIGMMVYNEPAYAASTKPEDQLAAMKHNQMQYFFSDVLLRGYYPSYSWRYFKENNICIEFGKEDVEDLEKYR